ncbi:uncharacterized protein RHO17_009645 [Thomomys bottae]
MAFWKRSSNCYSPDFFYPQSDSNLPWQIWEPHSLGPLQYWKAVYFRGIHFLNPPFMVKLSSGLHYHPSYYNLFGKDAQVKSKGLRSGPTEENSRSLFRCKFGPYQVPVSGAGNLQVPATMKWPLRDTTYSHSQLT